MKIIAIRTSKVDLAAGYLSLTKPKSILPHLITAAAAMILAADKLPSLVFIFTLIGGLFVVAAANTFNSYLDRDIDALMSRTSNRPLPMGMIKPASALAFAISIGFIGISILSILVSWMAAVLALVALLYYVCLYTIWLKRRTFWSVIAGSGIGAIPPLIGWIAVAHQITLVPILMSLLIIFWTIPHFWTLALFRNRDYEKAGIKLIPNRGVPEWIIICSLLLVATTLLLIPAANMGFFYIFTALLLGIVFIVLAALVEINSSLRNVLYLYRYSVLFIGLIFSAMIIDVFIKM